MKECQRSALEVLEGYKCKGLFYGGPGNLSDGSAALRTNFGDEVHQGDVIGVLIQRDGARLRMILYHNARCLGPAEDLPDQSNNHYVTVLCLVLPFFFPVAVPFWAFTHRSRVNSVHPQILWILSNLQATRRVSSSDQPAGCLALTHHDRNGDRYCL